MTDPTTITSTTGLRVAIFFQSGFTNKFGVVRKQELRPGYLVNTAQTAPLRPTAYPRSLR